MVTPKVVITHPEKIMFPDEHITKQDVIDYYQKIAPHFLRYAQNRPLSMRRFPEGIDTDKQESFFQKSLPDYFPHWIGRVTVPLKKGGEQTLVVLKTKDDLCYLANQNVLEFHTWLSTAKQPDLPNKIVFDLDPASKTLTKDILKKLRFTARALKTVLEQHKLTPFVMTTGSRGYHIVAPIQPKKTFAEVHEFAKTIASELADKHPKIMTADISLSKRKNKIFIDYLRNSYGQTSITPYSLRAKPGAPVATPIEWTELGTTTPDKYTIKNIFRHLARKQDPWKNMEQ